jgi:glyoxylase-like metal-dependent hydrolase (beta-lactamase superfamily II)
MALPFELQQVADGVHAAIAVPGAGAQGNAAIVDLGDRTLVFDTLLTPEAGNALCQAAERLTGRPPAHVVNSHWHADHVLGNQAFAPGAVFIGTERTRELMLAHRIAERLPPQVAGLEERLAGETDQAARVAIAETLSEARHLMSALPGLRRVYPDVLFERRLALQGSERRADVLCYGGGHTRSDAFVHLPGERVALMGDLVMAGVMPLLAHGDAREWRRMLEEVRALDVDRIVPGHGRAGGPADLDLTDAYLAWAIEVAASGGKAALEVPLPEPFAAWTHGIAHAVNMQALLAAPAA